MFYGVINNAPISFPKVIPFDIHYYRSKMKNNLCDMFYKCLADKLYFWVFIVFWLVL